jgi:hypothetical protein
MRRTRRPATSSSTSANSVRQRRPGSTGCTHHPACPSRPGIPGRPCRREIEEPIPQPYQQYPAACIGERYIGRFIERAACRSITPY